MILFHNQNPTNRIIATPPKMFYTLIITPTGISLEGYHASLVELAFLFVLAEALLNALEIETAAALSS